MNYAEYQRWYYEQRKRMGCVRCGERKERNKSRCVKCAALHARKARKLYNAKKPHKKVRQNKFMIHKLIDKLTEVLTPKQAILLMATYEKHGMEWSRRMEVTDGIICFTAEDTKCVNLAASRLLLLGFLEDRNGPACAPGRCKWVRVTEAGRKFLNGCYKHAQGKVAV